MEERKTRYPVSFLILFVLLFALLVANLCFGSVRIPFSEIASVLRTGGADDTNSRIIFTLRIPRLLAALFLGGALSVSGYLLQTFFGNPIAGPFVLGISSGAKLIVALVLITALNSGFVPGSVTLIAAAFLGSIAVMSLILVISSHVRQMSLLVVCGVMIGYICNAVTEIVISFAEDANIVNLHNWSMGSFSGIAWRDVYMIAFVCVCGVLCSFLLSKQMDAYRLGEDYARNLGVPLKRFRLQLILLSGLLSACVTAFAGPVSFVGIAVPHLMKSLFKTAKPMVLIPACFFGGAVFCLFCDLIARTLFAPTELSISAVTAVFGAPVVIRLLLVRSAERGRI